MLPRHRRLQLRRRSPVTQVTSIPRLEDIEAARVALEGIVQSTPMERSKALGHVLGHPVFLKCENLQRTGAYKLRGATVKMQSLTAEERARGVVAASAGNHAQGVALAAASLGVQATIFMPLGVALPKLQATKAYGAAVRQVGVDFGESLSAAIAFAESSGAIFIPPYDDPKVITGAGTVGLEILETLPEVRAIVVPIGGGGLISGVAIAAKERAKQLGLEIKVIGVQSVQASAFLPSLAAGQPVTIDLGRTIADGIAVPRPGDLTFDIVAKYVDEIVTVTDDEIAMAILMMLERAKLVVEPAGAVAEAAILAGKIHATGPTVAVASGGNIDPLLLERIIRYALGAFNRYTDISVMLPDRPGQLHRISQIIADADANVLEVLHTRHGKEFEFGDVELQLSIETKGPEHREAVLEALRAAGYSPMAG